MLQVQIMKQYTLKIDKMMKHIWQWWAYSIILILSVSCTPSRSSERVESTPIDSSAIQLVSRATEIVYTSEYPNNTSPEDVKRAIGLIDSALNFDTRYTFGHINRAQFHWMLRDTLACIQDLKRACISDSTEFSYLLRGSFYTKIGNHQLAKEDYQKGLDLAMERYKREDTHSLYVAGNIYILSRLLGKQEGVQILKEYMSKSEEEQRIIDNLLKSSSPLLSAKDFANDAWSQRALVPR